MKKYLPYIILIGLALFVGLFIYLKKSQPTPDLTGSGDLNQESIDSRKNTVYKLGYQTGYNTRKGRREYNPTIPSGLRKGDEDTYKLGYDKGYNEAKQWGGTIVGHPTEFINTSKN